MVGSICAKLGLQIDMGFLNAYHSDKEHHGHNTHPVAPVAPATIANFLRVPSLARLVRRFRPGARWQEASSLLARQWQNPSDVLTVLLIIGGDVVQKALAQLSGEYFVPVAFSFGWVSYSISALVVAFGEGTLMPSTPYPSVLVNAQSGYARLNYSWILNRLLRGIESSLEPLDAALCVSVYRCKPYGRRNAYDLLWWSGISTMAVQLGISSIPIVIERDWSTLVVTGTGTLLALVGGSLPQWRNEKWGSRYDNRGSTFCLTRGNGFQHVVVIQNEARGCPHLEHLAPPRRTGCSRGCKVMVMISAFLWILFLINVCGVRQNTWYLLIVGFMGMIQNVFVAAIPRQPSAMGLPLEFVDRIDGEKVMRVLMDTEIRFPSVGAALVQTFFPGKLRDHAYKNSDGKRSAIDKAASLSHSLFSGFSSISTGFEDNSVNVSADQ